MLQEILDKYLALFPAERVRLALLLEQVARGDEMNNRQTLPGHATGGAIVLSPDKKQILLIHHRTLNMWLQPGGHWDPDEASPWEAAKREAEEETGVHIAEQLTIHGDDSHIPLDINSHAIPANPAKGEPAHTHHDFRYVFIAKDKDILHDAREVRAAGWFNFDAPECTEVQSIIRKLRQSGLVI